MSIFMLFLAIVRLFIVFIRSMLNIYPYFRAEHFPVRHSPVSSQFSVLTPAVESVQSGPAPSSRGGPGTHQSVQAEAVTDITCES